MNRAKNRRNKKLADKGAKKTKPVEEASPLSIEQEQTLTIQQAVELAVQHHNAGDLPKAEDIYQQVLQADPNQPVALHFLGLIAHQAGKNDTAFDLISKALTIKPDYVEAHCNLGIVLKTLGKLDEAISSYQKALAIKSNFAEAHYSLGNAFNGLGKLDEAVASYNRALAIKSDYADAHSNLGNTFKGLGRFDEALSSYNKALAIKPDFAEVHYNLGNIHQTLGKLDEAVARYKKALGIKPDFAEAHSNLGNVLKDLGKLDEAVTSFKKALAIRPDYAEAHSNLGNALKDFGQLDEAVVSYKKALGIKPDYAEAYLNLGVVFQELEQLDEAVDSYVRALEIMPENDKASIALSHVIYKFSIEDSNKAQELALNFTEAFPKNDILRRGVSGITKTINYSTETERLYTTSIFNSFAKTFDKKLEELSYDLPEKLAQAARAVDGSYDLDILDAGCGTGLCGTYLRARARHLVGVDLSVNMLTKARGKRLYDDLVEADLVSFMEDKPTRFDLVMSADVLVYIGEIAPLAQAAYLTLRSGGVCVVSVESLDDDVGPPFLLAPNGRYRHSARYIKDTFTSVGFTVNPLQKTSVRIEYGVPVNAWILVAQK